MSNYWTALATHGNDDDKPQLRVSLHCSGEGPRVGSFEVHMGPSLSLSPSPAATKASQSCGVVCGVSNAEWIIYT